MVKAKGANGGSVSKGLPLIFGVSGHRDLLIANVPQLREHLFQIFARFRTAYRIPLFDSSRRSQKGPTV